jgi:hypothetical protein
MDIVMHIVRKHKLKLEDSFEFIVNNPEEIEITRGELYGKKGTKIFKEKG